MRHTRTQTYKRTKITREIDYVALRYLDRSTVLMVFLNDCSDLKTTMSAGRSFHTFTTLMLKKDVSALQWLKGLYSL